MTSVHRSRLTFHNIGSSHVAVFRQTAQDPTHSCKFTKWRQERCQAQRVIVKIVRKPKQPMLYKYGDAILVRADNSIKQNTERPNPHRPS